MPNNIEWSIHDIKEITINPIGWISNLTIEYGISDTALALYYWRVKGTKHTFTIPVLRLDYISSGEYDKHFTEVLQKFREDYNKWKDEGFVTEWSREYRDQYDRFIC